MSLGELFLNGLGILLLLGGIVLVSVVFFFLLSSMVVYACWKIPSIPMTTDYSDSLLWREEEWDNDGDTWLAVGKFLWLVIGIIGTILLVGYLASLFGVSLL